MLERKDFNSNQIDYLSNSSSSRLKRKKIYDNNAQITAYPRSKSISSLQKCDTSFQEYCVNQFEKSVPSDRDKDNKKFNKTVSYYNHDIQNCVKVTDPQKEQMDKNNVNESANFLDRLRYKAVKNPLIIAPKPAQLLVPKKSKQQQQLMKLKQIIDELQLSKIQLQQQKDQFIHKIKELNVIIRDMDGQNQRLTNNYVQLEARKNQLETIISQGQHSLQIANNTLSQLKQTINQNKIQQLQFENQKSQRIIKNLKQENSNLADKNQAIELKYEQAQQQICRLHQNKMNQVTNSRFESQREQFLSQQVDRLRKQIAEQRSEQEQKLEDSMKYKDELIISLSQELKNQRRKRHFLQYTLNKQIVDIKNKSEEQVKATRIRYSKMMANLKQKINKSGGKETSTIAPISKNRVGVMDNRSSRGNIPKSKDQQIQLCLSPEP